MPDLRELFAGLPLPPTAPPDASILTATQVPERPSFRVACDSSRHPLLLLESSGYRAGMPPLALEHLRIEHARTCRVQARDGSLIQGVFTIFACTSADTVLQDHFLLVAGALVAATPPNPEPEAVAHAIETMAELFRALNSGGELHVVDFGKPQTLYGKQLKPLLHEFEEVNDNVDGRLPAIFEGAGFKIQERGNYSTFFGELTFLQGVRP